VKLNDTKIQKVPGESRSDSVCIQQHQHQHVTAKLRNSGTPTTTGRCSTACRTRGAVVEAHQPEKRDTSTSPKEHQKRESDTSAGSDQQQKRENKGLALVHILQERKGVCAVDDERGVRAVCTSQQRQEKKRGVCAVDKRKLRQKNSSQKALKEF